MTMSDLQGHSSTAGVFKCDFSYTCAPVDKILTDSASRGPSEIAELLVDIRGIDSGRGAASLNAPSPHFDDKA